MTRSEWYCSPPWISKHHYFCKWLSIAFQKQASFHFLSPSSLFIYIVIRIFANIVTLWGMEGGDSAIPLSVVCCCYWCWCCHLRTRWQRQVLFQEPKARASVNTSNWIKCKRTFKNASAYAHLHNPNKKIYNKGQYTWIRKFAKESWNHQSKGNMSQILGGWKTFARSKIAN